MASLWPLTIAARLLDLRGMSLVSTLSMSGLVLSVAVLVLVLSVMNGFETELRERVLEVLPHGSIHAEGRSGEGTVSIGNLAAVREAAASHPDVRSALSVNSGRGLLVAGDSLRGIRVDGIDPNHFGGSTVSRKEPEVVDSVDPSNLGGSTASTRVIWAGRQRRPELFCWVHCVQKGTWGGRQRRPE